MIDGHRRTLERLIEILESARTRPAMYFEKVNAEHANAWIWGVWIALSAAGLEAQAQDYREKALARRDIYLEAHWHDSILRERLISEAEVVDELLAIEIETFRLLHAALGFWVGVEDKSQEGTSGPG